MIFTDFTYNGITFKKFVRTSGYMAEVVSGDKIQIRSTIDPIPSGVGIQRYIDYYGARLLQISGFIKGSSQSDLYTKIQALQNAFDIKNLETVGNYGFQALQWTDPGQNTARYYVKPLTNTLVVEEERRGLVRSFSVLMQAKDPVKYSITSVVYTITPTTAAGSSVLPKTLPVVLSGNANFGQTAVTNTGATSVFPASIVLTGPSSGSWQGPKITNLTTGAYLQFLNTFSIATGGFVTITPNLGQAIYTSPAGGTTDLSASIVFGSSFFLLVSGVNNIQISGSSLPATAQATITVTSSF